MSDAGGHAAGPKEPRQKGPPITQARPPAPRCSKGKYLPLVAHQRTKVHTGWCSERVKKVLCDCNPDIFICYILFRLRPRPDLNAIKCIHIWSGPQSRTRPGPRARPHVASRACSIAPTSANDLHRSRSHHTKRTARQHTNNHTTGTRQQSSSMPQAPGAPTAAAPGARAAIRVGGGAKGQGC